MTKSLESINNSTFPEVYRWRPAAWLRVTGADAAHFLQGQFTNELRSLALGAAAYGLWLNVKGKVLADSFVVRGRAENEFWVGSYFSRAETIRERLESFVIADDVSIEDETAKWRAASGLGAGAAAAFTRWSSAGWGFVFPGRRMRDENMEWVFPASAEEEVAALWREASLLGSDEIVRRRIHARIPAVPLDVGPTDLPNEGGLEADAISYTKGCYLGQEVMARLKSMGQVRRRLLAVRGSGVLPVLPAPLFLGNRQIGELRSVAREAEGFVGLAMLSLLHAKAGAELALAAEASPIVHLLDAP